jgi:hypothetical protein
MGKKTAGVNQAPAVHTEFTMAWRRLHRKAAAGVGHFRSATFTPFLKALKPKSVGL